MALYRCHACDVLTTIPDGENPDEYFCEGCDGTGCLRPAENVVMMRDVPRGKRGRGFKEPKKPTRIGDYKQAEVPRIAMNPQGFGVALPVGITVLLSGDPGAGKSTFLVQSLSTVIENGGSALYLGCEEASVRVAMRGRRVNAHPDIRLLYTDSLYAINRWIAKEKPTVAVIDSINNIVSVEAEGENKSLIERLVLLRKTCEKVGTTAIIICHVNKDGDIYGPERLQHECDIYMHIENDVKTEVRTIRAYKNRNHETGVYAAFRLTESGCVFCPIPGSKEDLEAQAEAEGNARG